MPLYPHIASKFETAPERGSLACSWLLQVRNDGTGELG